MDQKSLLKQACCVATMPRHANRNSRLKGGQAGGPENPSSHACSRSISTHACSNSNSSHACSSTSPAHPVWTRLLHCIDL
jgi:hypothetical protein